MNARLYDPLLAHVVSPDNYVQAPDYTQSYNRYSYCINNPLKYTDPSGNEYNIDLPAVEIVASRGGGGGGEDEAGSGAGNSSFSLPNLESIKNIQEKIAFKATCKTVTITANRVVPKINGTTPWLNYAQGELGQIEMNPGDNSSIISYHATTGGFKNDETAWCSSFVNWSLTQAGVRGTNSARAYSWKTWGQTLPRPAYGSIAIANFSHVGFVAGVNSAGRIILLGGNQGQPGAVTLSPINPNSIIQYVYPSGFSPNYSLPVLDINRSSMNYNFTH
jgi:uncharacterized protein (TIGR02594 family)